MKFKHYLEGIAGIGVYPMISLVIFFGFFSLLTIWAIKVRKDYVNTMKQIPLSETEIAGNQQNAI
ncbi:CcoQ/FixQ family Cbb3-type cytochrome c oxidase assembly chaperone [Polluticoccus soli]|uniref:CcoQ/FixQ family Cbb3-type cytochrome c oxidase assembly chaperone n=1 Tax=Polluticoccus soli TaxID=3034150 RepID=UPI0023E203BD|nr:CcoQ/FixQ family Cbb3-type cytochrome c oxidase assembly chaperone [Flavipsychrobacter sp. JY13-12]